MAAHIPGISAARAAKVYSEAVAFFGDDDLALAWLKTQQSALDATPLTLLDTESGAEKVSTLLRQLAWGIYS